MSDHTQHNPITAGTAKIHGRHHTDRPGAIPVTTLISPRPSPGVHRADPDTLIDRLIGQWRTTAAHTQPRVQP